MCVLSHFSHVQLFVMPWIVTHQAPLSTGFSKQENWSGLLCCPPGDLLDPEIKPTYLTLLHWKAGSLTLAQLCGLSAKKMNTQGECNDMAGVRRRNFHYLLMCGEKKQRNHCGILNRSRNIKFLFSIFIGL